MRLAPSVKEHCEDLIAGSELLDSSLPLFDGWILELASNLLEFFELTQLTGSENDGSFVLNIDPEFIIHIWPWSNSLSW